MPHPQVRLGGRESLDVLKGGQEGGEVNTEDIQEHIVQNGSLDYVETAIENAIAKLKNEVDSPTATVYEAVNRELKAILTTLKEEEGI